MHLCTVCSAADLHLINQTRLNLESCCRLLGSTRRSNVLDGHKASTATCKNLTSLATTLKMILHKF